MPPPAKSKPPDRLCSFRNRLFAGTATACLYSFRAKQVQHAQAGGMAKARYARKAIRVGFSGRTVFRGRNEAVV